MEIGSRNMLITCRDVVAAGSLDRAALIAAAGAEEKDDTGDVMLHSGRDFASAHPSDIAKVRRCFLGEMSCEVLEAGTALQ